MSGNMQALKTRIHAALAGDHPQASTKKAVDHLRSSRARAIAQYGADAFEGLRETGKQIRSHTIAHLDYYLNQFAENVERNGGQVHFAADSAEVTAIVLEIARSVGARTVAKSKSMISEEVHLNRALEAAGITSVETDLGEYIIQQAGEEPCHLVTPAIYKPKEEIVELFRELSGEALSADAQELGAYARRKLREAFQAADIGLTGCNFGIAEAGAVAVVSNEGNGRMVTTLPRVQIVLMGMERIVPGLAELDVMLDLLARSATGQRSTVYVSISAGTRRPGEAEGPEQFHVVVVDNGRLNALGGEYQEVLNCIRCGACQNACPVYRNIGGHAYGSVYAGPIGAVITPILQGVEARGDTAHASSLCGACWEACPVKIPIHEILVGLRRDEAKETQRPWWERTAYRLGGWVLSTGWVYRWAGRLGGWGGRLFGRSGYTGLKLWPLTLWTKTRDLPVPTGPAFRAQWAALEQEAAKLRAASPFAGVAARAEASRGRDASAPGERNGVFKDGEEAARGA